MRIVLAVAVSLLVELMAQLDLHPVAELMHSPCSVSVIKGSTALEHLNRTLTVDTLEMQFKDRLDGLICNANGRILDRLMICNLENEILLIGNFQTGEYTRENLIQGIPWDEEITVMDGDSAITHLRLVGKAVNRCLVGLGIDPLEISEGRWIEYGSALFSRTESEYSSVIEILLPSSDQEAFTNLLHENGAVSSDRDRSEYVRIELGLLDYREINSAFLPIELKLGHLVNLEKGCYPGQEIHARLDSRGKASRGIVRLNMPTSVAIGKHKVEGVGNITITASTTAPKGSVALAIVPIPAITLEQLNLGDGMIATVQSL